MLLSIAEKLASISIQRIGLGCKLQIANCKMKITICKWLLSRIKFELKNQIVITGSQIINSHQINRLPYSISQLFSAKLDSKKIGITNIGCIENKYRAKTVPLILALGIVIRIKIRFSFTCLDYA
ncbi:MAG: hypothetical protein DRR16_02650 [Candidatus Parabeggiatoa sp. nov. 3]|nr:MAG: hypothetical protein DRR00_10505 [Gammaproteobacteria bacterium]RKZ65770.1 MAG: hypothetical protein DRQ99_11685 [Gammaproteobacteria bacterium]RKZ89386.1 MAG: hypothetical protein DRR16_02650 [Gammaproteobacteria bacterium]